MGTRARRSAQPLEEATAGENGTTRLPERAACAGARLDASDGVLERAEPIGHRLLRGSRAPEIAKQAATSPTSAPPAIRAACANPRSGMAIAATTARQQAQAITASSIVSRVSLRVLRRSAVPELPVSSLIRPDDAMGKWRTCEAVSQSS